MANQFGGEWTEIKIRVFKKYLYAYMQIMKGKRWKLIYFDGFAGSGDIQTQKETEEVIEGTARHVLSFDEPRKFDFYYFVEKDLDNAQLLQRIINSDYPSLVEKSKVAGGDDCNEKLIDMADFLRKPEGKNYKAIAFIDPYGMQVKWSTLESLKGLGVDLWILVPTGIGINRLLKKKEKSDQVWFETLGKFFGLDPKEIEERFYYEDPQMDLFGERKFKKIENAVEVAAALYQERLKTVFKYVSEPLPLRNSTNAVLFHFMSASNVPVAVKIANDIIKKEK
jgi:three-Cys-motif partner protein